MSKTPMYLCKCNSCACMFMAYGRGEPLCKQCREAVKANGGGEVSGEFELFDCDMYPEDDEPEHVCTCNVIHDDLEHAENLCSACGLMLIDPWAPVQVVPEREDAP